MSPSSPKSSKRAAPAPNAEPLEPSASRRREGAFAWALPWFAPAVFLALWWIVSELGLFPPILLPSPQAVFSRAWQLLASGELFEHAATSLARVFAGFLISSTLALACAFLFHALPRAERAASLVFEALRVVPPLSLVPLLILWLGIDEAPKLAIVILASFFPIYLSSFDALRSTDRSYASLARILGLSSAERIRHVLLPGAAPGILTGLRLGFGYAWRALVGAELIAAASGLGYLIEDASMLAKTDIVMVGILSIAVLGVACDALFRRVLERFLPGRSRKAGKPVTSKAASTSAADLRRATADDAQLPGIDIARLRAGYPDAQGIVERPTIDGLSLALRPGTITALLGRSGCGKTTLLKVIAGLLPASGGRVTFSSGKRPLLGMVFQAPTLLPWKTVRENVRLALLGEPVSQADARVDEVLALVGLLARAEDYPQNLSGGQQQRVGFARALARSPKLLLMDEPFGALDAITRSELQRESIRIFASTRMTVLMITHDVREAVAMADRIAVMAEGTIAASFDLKMPQPRRLTDPKVAALEERILAELLSR